ncbi:unnamed protein product [Enterobius vermicularis]|uniref:Neural proliferation differentiation and control protein 1 n=1 Tax=Enterobius vermicularis TaxID=51028 RepID=A0A0N4UWZ0_ENTVE|nr:unnamed protein product [Enterobius vermicularis]
MKVSRKEYDNKNIDDFVYDISLLKAPQNYGANKSDKNSKQPESKKVAKGQNEEKEPEGTLESLQEQPVLTQKKGQNEFVEFVDPKPDKQLKKVEVLEKRVETRHNRVYVSPLTTGGNLLFVSVATVCIIAAVIGIIGGTYYFHKVRSQRIEDAFSNFSHYAPTGPGKEKKKKDGDEGLAYRAQLHHYQQTKQKIISGNEQDIGIPEPDDASEASDYDDNNFSVYECPGLAPTGDLEVQNPNFTRP